MWIQILTLVSVFGLGYFFAVSGAGPSQRPSPGDGAPAEAAAESAEDNTMAGSFPEQNNASADGVSEKKSKGKKKRKSNKAAAPRAGATSATVEDKQLQSQQPQPQPQTSEPGDWMQEKEDAEAEAEDSAGRAAEQDDEWEAVGQQRVAVARKRQAAPIPVHRSAWEQLASDEDLDAEESKPTGARILRIGAPARPPQPSPQRVRYKPPTPPPLTKKQRQNQRKAERVREQRAQAAELQNARLQQHQYEQFEVRSREQWKKAQRAAAKRSWAPASGQKPGTGSAQPAIPKAAAERIEGKLLWD